jgi:hypothetical protein
MNRRGSLALHQPSISTLSRAVHGELQRVSRILHRCPLLTSHVTFVQYSGLHLRSAIAPSRTAAAGDMHVVVALAAAAAALAAVAAAAAAAAAKHV